jgi:hypothetical protein
VTERSRQDILDPIVGESDPSSRPRNGLPNDPVLALEGDVSLNAVAIIGPAIAHKDCASPVDHDLADDSVISKLLPSEVQCLADESQVNVSGSCHRRSPSGDLPDRKVERPAPQAMLGTARPSSAHM